MYKKIDSIILNGNVHEDIQSQFNIAKNLFVYSWYVYSFNNIAELKAISTLEFTLRTVLNKKRLGLKKLLIYAIENDLIIDSRLHEEEDDFLDYKYSCKEKENIDLKKQTKYVVNYITSHRNNLAHGSTTLTIPSPDIFEITADFINQLFKQ